MKKQQRYKDIRLGSILGLVGNIFLLIIKAIIGIFTKSEAMIADAFNSAGDIISSLMTYIGNKVAIRPRDDKHNLGYGKAEYIYSMLVSLVILITGIKVLKDSLMAIFYHHMYNYSHFLIIVCIITIIIKFFLFIYTDKLSKKYHNLLIKANSKDHRNDIFISSLNLISCICAYYKIFIVDGIVGSLISIWIIITGIKIFKESYDVLMDKGISEELKEEIFTIINTHPEIKKVIHFNSTPVGYRYQISFSIFLDGNLSTFESHEIANNLEEEIHEKVPEVYLTVIHVNPWKNK